MQKTVKAGFAMGKTPLFIPIAGDADGIKQHPAPVQPQQPQPQSKKYLEQVIEGLSKADVTREVTSRKPNRYSGKIQSNSLKGGSGAKWILHKKIGALIQQGYTRKMICKELDICRMTIWRHQNEY